MALRQEFQTEDMTQTRAPHLREARHPLLTFILFNQSIKSNSGCLTHMKRRHTHIQEKKGKKTTKHYTVATCHYTSLPVNYNVC